MAEYKATSEQWADVGAFASDTRACLLELRARVEQLEAGLKDEADCNKACTFNIVDRVKALEAKYETMRLATLEWGEDVDKVKRWSDQHLQRIEKLEGTRRPASRVQEISEPLQLTPEQAQHVRDLLAPNSKPTPNPSQIRSSLVERVQQAINTEYEESLGTGSMEARAAIREVAAWLRDTHARVQIPVLLEKEAER